MIGKVWPVQNIKSVPAKNQPHALCDGSGLNYSNVSDALIRPAEDISSEAPEYRPATGNRIFAINKATIWNKRRRNKRFRVKEFVDSAADAAAPTGIPEYRTRSQASCGEQGCGTKQRTGCAV